MSNLSDLRDLIVDRLKEHELKRICDDFSLKYPRHNFNYSRDIPGQGNFEEKTHETLERLHQIRALTDFERFLYQKRPDLRTTPLLPTPPFIPFFWFWPGLVMALSLALLFVLWNQSNEDDDPIPTATFTATQEAILATATQLALLPTATFAPQNSPVPPTATPTLTATETKPPMPKVTKLPTNTPVPPTLTFTPTATKPPNPISTPIPTLHPVTFPTPEAGTKFVFSLPTRDEVIMVFIPTGLFLMGSNDYYDDEQPVHELFIDSFWIDITEVTNEQYGYYAEAKGINFSFDHELANHPVVNINWNEATAFCEWRGAKLPTEAQWEKAARWNPITQEAYLYPWGNEFQTGWSNCAENSCQDGFSGTSSVGSFSPEGNSPYGLQDMAGNVWEWTSSNYTDSYADNAEVYNSLYVVRGGAWFYSEDLIRSSNRNWGNSKNSYSTVGFRCASTLE